MPRNSCDNKIRHGPGLQYSTIGAFASMVTQFFLAVENDETHQLDVLCFENMFLMCFEMRPLNQLESQISYFSSLTLCNLLWSKQFVII